MWRAPFEFEITRDAKLMRDVLIDHMDGRLVSLAERPRQQTRSRRAFKWLVDCKMLELVPEEMPRHSVITDKGREELAALLADYAECLLRVALVRENSPPPPPLSREESLKRLIQGHARKALFLGP